MDEQQQQQQRTPGLGLKRSSSNDDIFDDPFSGAPEPKSARRDTSSVYSGSAHSSSGGGGGALIKGAWSTEEDELMRAAVAEVGLNFKLVAERVPGRNSKQCRDRYKLKLDPRINHGPFTAEEDARLVELHSEMGRQWTKIAKLMPGRTENSVKSRFASLDRSRKREWTPDEEALLRRLRDAGISFDAIAAQHMPSRTEHAVRRHWERLCMRDLARRIKNEMPGTPATGASDVSIGSGGSAEKQQQQPQQQQPQQQMLQMHQHQELGHDHYHQHQEDERQQQQQGQQSSGGLVLDAPLGATSAERVDAAAAARAYEAKMAQTVPETPPFMSAQVQPTLQPAQLPPHVFFGLSSSQQQQATGAQPFPLPEGRLRRQPLSFEMLGLIDAAAPHMGARTSSSSSASSAPPPVSPHSAARLGAASPMQQQLLASTLDSLLEQGGHTETLSRLRKHLSCSSQSSQGSLGSLSLWGASSLAGTLARSSSSGGTNSDSTALNSSSATATSASAAPPPPQHPVGLPRHGQAPSPMNFALQQLQQQNHHPFQFLAHSGGDGGEAPRPRSSTRSGNLQRHSTSMTILKELIHEPF